MATALGFALHLLELGLVLGAVAVVAFLTLIQRGQVGSRRVNSFGPMLGLVAVVGLVIGLLAGQGLLAVLAAAGLVVGVAVGGGAATLLLGRMLPPA